MLLFVQIDLTFADLSAFEAYETKALALLDRYGGRLEERLRSDDGGSEFHLLYFPSTSQFDAFRADADRAALQPLWERSGATSRVTQVIRIP